MKDLLNNWSIMRVLRLVIGAYIISLYFQEAQGLYLFLGGMLIVQGAFNLGCVGGACAAPTSQKPFSSNDAVNFEEIK